MIKSKLGWLRLGSLTEMGILEVQKLEFEYQVEGGR